MTKGAAVELPPQPLFAAAAEEDEGQTAKALLDRAEQSRITED